jgi:hypothetical protein
MARVTFEDRKASRMGFSFVRQQDNTEVVMRPPAEEAETLAQIEKMSKRFNTRFEISGDEVLVRAA